MQVHPSSYSSYTYAEACQNQVIHLLYTSIRCTQLESYNRWDAIAQGEYYTYSGKVLQMDLRGTLTHPLTDPDTQPISQHLYKACVPSYQ